MLFSFSRLCYFIALLVFFAAVVCLQQKAVHATEPNDTFAQATILAPGILTTGSQSLSDGGLGVTYPDTTLGIFSDASFSTLVDVDDEGGGIIGNGHGSAFFGRDVPTGGVIPLTVSGYSDFNFDGIGDFTGQPHQQTGEVDLIVVIWDIVDPTIEFDRQEVALNLTPGDTFSHVFDDSTWFGHQFTAIADNTVEGGNDVDYFRFTGLTPGDLFEAETASTWNEQDTILGWFDGATGTLLEMNDDVATSNLLSRIEGTVPASGELVFATTSFDDNEFIGAHGGSGEYSLSLTMTTLFQPADFNEDGNVDGNDFLAWQNGFGIQIGATHAQGDANGDGAVDGNDFLAWQNQFGSGAGSGSTVVPEPTTLLLVMVLAMVIGCHCLACPAVRSGV